MSVLEIYVKRVFWSLVTSMPVRVILALCTGIVYQCYCCEQYLCEHTMIAIQSILMTICMLSSGTITTVLLGASLFVSQQCVGTFSRGNPEEWNCQVIALCFPKSLNHVCIPTSAR